MFPWMQRLYFFQWESKNRISGICAGALQILQQSGTRHSGFPAKTLWNGGNYGQKIFMDRIKKEKLGTSRRKEQQGNPGRPEPQKWEEQKHQDRAEPHRKEAYCRWKTFRYKPYRLWRIKAGFLYPAGQRHLLWQAI